MAIKNTPTILVQNAGALGDFVASLGGIKHAYETWFQDSSFYVLCQPTFAPLIQFMPKSRILDITKDHKMQSPHAVLTFNEVETLPNGAVGARIHPLRMALWDYASIKLFNRVFNHKDISYPKLKLHDVNTLYFGLPEKYATIIVNHSAANRKIDPSVFNAISDYLTQKGIKPVFIGKSKCDFQTLNVAYKRDNSIDMTKGLDLTDKTTVMEAADIMSRAKFVLGVDGGLMHLAGMTEAKIVGAYTTVAPELRMPIRNGIMGYNCFPVVPDVSCSFCSNKFQIEGHDFNNCLRMDNKCAKELTFDKFKVAIDAALKQ